LGTVINGLIEKGFVISGLWETFRISNDAPPGTWDHFEMVAPPGFAIDDLVSKSTDRSKGYGGRLIDWLVEYARQNDCDDFHLDSGVQRFGPHRFYLNKRMEIACHHFALKLKG
jgi:GNAT superfamily N-acetyltransferase